MAILSLVSGSPNTRCSARMLKVLKMMLKVFFCYSVNVTVVLPDDMMASMHHLAD